jgi:hypothetical protein
LNEPDLPCFPISVLFHEDGDKWVLNNHAEVGFSLEWFDSRDKNENASVTMTHLHSVFACSSQRAAASASLLPPMQ